jgi:predicted metal-binding membrane protein
MTADWFFAALRHDRAIVLGSLTLVILLAWAWLLVGAGIDMEEMDMGGGQIMLMLPEWSLGYGLVVFAMWAVMMVAMMLPSAAPVTLLVAGIAGSAPRRAEISAAARRCSCSAISRCGSALLRSRRYCNGDSTKPACYPTRWPSSAECSLPRS